MKVSCPQCGGEVHLQETSGLVGCPFCGTSLILDLTGVRPHLLFRPRHALADVLPLLRRWSDGRALPPPSRPTAFHLVFRPFWRFAAQGHSRLIPAWPELEARWADVSPPPAEQVIYDPAAVGDGRVIEPSVAEAAARQRVFGGAAAAVGAGDLVHVPFFEGGAMLGACRMGVSVEACSGRVYPDRTPPGAREPEARQAARLTTAILGFLGMFLEAMLIPSLWLTVVVVGVTGLVVYQMLVNSA